MASHIIIRHISPGQEDRIEQFALDGLLELSVGRDPGCNVVFDSARDEYVSRRHAAIRIENGEHFKLADLGSRNGTLLNGQAISTEVELSPGDTIELGLGGPKLMFDVEPRPAHFLSRTRVLPKGVAATRVLSPAATDASAKAAAARAQAANAAAAAKAAAASAVEVTKPAIGRNTVMGMMKAEQVRTNRNWMYILAGVLLLVAVGGGGLYWHNKIKADEAAAEMLRQAEELKAQKEAAADQATRQLAELRAQREAAAAAVAKQAADMKAQREAAEKSAERAREESQAALRKAVGLSPKEIVQKYAQAVALIEMQWHVVDGFTGKPIYQKVITRQIDGEKVPSPAYVLISDDKLVRWLTTDDENQSNIPIAAAGSGTGFVVSSQGYLLTNKHVAAGWGKPFTGDLECVKERKCGTGLVFPLNGGRPPIEINPLAVAQLRYWIPESGMVFRADQPIAIGSDSPHMLEGRNDMLEVGFPGNPLRISARLMRASVPADAALIKVDTLQPLKTVEVSDGSVAAVGEQITALGYPDYSDRDQRIVAIGSADRTSPVQQRRLVPDPTVTSGNISLVTPRDYQITATISHGNSGGPLFDRAGKVIGIVTYGTNRETTNYAIPIKYGLELLRTQ
jgi:S1-C subfamily serine protease